MLKIAVSDSVPLCADDDDLAKILRDSYVAAELKVKLTHEYKKYMEKAIEFATCAVCGEFGSPNVEQHKTFDKAAMHFYRLYESFGNSMYFNLQRKLIAANGEVDKRRLNRRLRLLNVVVIGEETYQLYEKGIKTVDDGDGNGQISKFTVCGKCARDHKALKRKYKTYKCEKPCVLVAGLKESVNGPRSVELCAPRRSLAHWDYGKNPLKVEPHLPELTIPEKLAL